MKVKLSAQENALLDKLKIDHAESMTTDTADNVVNLLSDELQSLEQPELDMAEDIITKITTNPEW